MKAFVIAVAAVAKMGWKPETRANNENAVAVAVAVADSWIQN